MTDLIKSILDLLGFNPTIGAILVAIVGSWPKLEEILNNWRNLDNDIKINKLYLEHLKLQLEIKAIARNANEDINGIAWPELPALPTKRLLSPVLPWKIRFLFCLFGIFLAMLPIAIIAAYFAFILFGEGGDFAWIVFALFFYVSMFIGVASVVAIIPFRYRWQATLLGALLSLTVVALSVNLGIEFFPSSMG